MWLGLLIMVAMVVGLVVWCVWAYRKDQGGQKPAGNGQTNTDRKAGA